MKTVKVFITVLFLLMFSVGVQAQVAYEYATVCYSSIYPSRTKGKISISKQDKFEEIEVKVSESVLRDNDIPVIAVLNKMSSEGWEVYNSNALSFADTDFHHYYYLRKKKN